MVNYLPEPQKVELCREVAAHSEDKVAGTENILRSDICSAGDFVHLKLRSVSHLSRP